MLVVPDYPLAPLPLLDISELGTRVRLARPPESGDSAAIPRAGARAMGSLVLGIPEGGSTEGVRFPIRARFVHLGPDTAGLEFVDTPRTLQQLIRAYFRSELLGASLRPLRSAGRRDLLRFSDEGPNWVEIELCSSSRRTEIELCSSSRGTEIEPAAGDPASIERFSAELGTLGVHLRWSRALPHLDFQRVRPRALELVAGEAEPRDVLRALRNVQGLPAAVLAGLELIFSL